MMEKILKAFGYVREEDLAEVKEELLAALRCEERLLKRSLALVKEKEALKRLLTEKEAQYAEAVSRWAGLASLWQEEHGGGMMYVKSEERKEEENEDVALEIAAVSAGCATEGAEKGADCDPSELAGQGNTGASAGEQGDGIPKG